MKTYSIYLASHTNAPDYENEYEAETKDEAVKFFMQLLGKYGWDKEIIEKNTDEGVSTCCGAGTYNDYMICESCKEHC